MKNNSRKKFQKYVDLYGTISMFEFLNIYVGVNSQFKSLKKATHKDIRLLNFVGVISVPFDILHNDDLATGNVILVEDAMHNIGAYINPLRIVEVNNELKNRVRRI